MSVTDENGGVRYTVKELVQDVTRTIADDRRETLGTLARIEGKLDAKADRATVHALELRVAALELVNASTPHLADAFRALDEKNTALSDQIVALNESIAGDEKVARFKRWLVNVSIALVLALVAVVGLVLRANSL